VATPAQHTKIKAYYGYQTSQVIEIWQKRLKDYFYPIDKH
jgi:hypothetical protein